MKNHCSLNVEDPTSAVGAVITADCLEQAINVDAVACVLPTYHTPTAHVSLAKACGTHMLLLQDSAYVDIQRGIVCCDRYQQIGNAVSPCVASALGRCLALAAVGAVAPDLDHAVVPVPDPQLIKVVTLSSHCAACEGVLCLMFIMVRPPNAWLPSLQADPCCSMSPGPSPPPQKPCAPQADGSPKSALAPILC